MMLSDKLLNRDDRLFNPNKDTPLCPVILVEKTFRPDYKRQTLGSKHIVWGLVLSGKGSFTRLDSAKRADQKATHHLHAGSCFIHSPGIHFSLQAHSPLHVVSCAFYDSYARSEVQKILAQLCGAWDLSDLTRCRQLWDCCWQQAHFSNAEKLLQQLAIALLQASVLDQGKKIKAHHLLEEAKLQFQRGACTGVSVQGIADRLGLSYEHLSRYFRQHFGLSPKAYIQELRKNAALQLIHENELNLEEIAQHVGYTDLSAFSKAFHKWCQMSPSQYRKSIAV